MSSLMSVEPVKKKVEHVHLARRHVVETDRVSTQHDIVFPLPHKQSQQIAFSLHVVESVSDDYNF